MFVHPCCCICFIEWCFFKFKMVLKILLKELSKRCGNKKEKVYFSPSPLSGSAQFLPPPPPPRGLSFPLSSFFPRGPNSRPTLDRPASRALHLAAATDRADPCSWDTDRWGPVVRVVPYLVSEQDTSPSRNHHARSARAVPAPHVFPPLYTCPDPRQAPYPILAPAAAWFSPKNIDEIRAEAISPL